VDWHAQRRSFTAYRQKDGLPNDTIYGILPGRQNHLWLSTIPLVGISRDDSDTLTNTALGQITTIDIGPINYTSPLYWYPWFFSNPKTQALFDRQKNQFTHNFKDQAIYQLFEDKQHKLWTATSDGLRLYNNKTGNLIVPS
jgi:ligand-binding sensor domain-containing protein